MIVRILLAALLAAPLLPAQDEPKTIDVTQIVVVTPLTAAPFAGTVLLLSSNGDGIIVKLDAILACRLADTITVPRSAVLVEFPRGPSTPLGNGGGDGGVVNLPGRHR